MISLSMIFNKITGFYGLLAVLTGMRLSPLQLSMYIYSVGALVLLVFLVPHIRKQSPFECLALAWFYLLDTVINTAFTAAFALTWFIAVSAKHTNTNISSSAPGVDNTAAGFTSLKSNVSVVGAVPGGSATTGQDALAHAAVNPSLSHGVGIEESIPSIMVVVFLTLVRVYFILVAMAYARQVLRQHVSSTRSMPHQIGGQVGELENPFSNGSFESEGWRGKLGRIMVAIGENYWLGGQADDDWAKEFDGRFKATKTMGGPSGTLERERRARSGTGPPLPSPHAFKI
jgi:hypothetical protein